MDSGADIGECEKSGRDFDKLLIRPLVLKNGYVFCRVLTEPSKLPD